MDASPDAGDPAPRLSLRPGGRRVTAGAGVAHKKAPPDGRRCKSDQLVVGGRGGALQVRRTRGYFFTKPIFCIWALRAVASTLARMP